MKTRVSRTMKVAGVVLVLVAIGVLTGGQQRWRIPILDSR